MPTNIPCYPENLEQLKIRYNYLKDKFQEFKDNKVITRNAKVVILKDIAGKLNEIKADPQKYLDKCRNQAIKEFFITNRIQ